MSVGTFAWSKASSRLRSRACILLSIFAVVLSSKRSSRSLSRNEAIAIIHSPFNCTHGHLLVLQKTCFNKWITVTCNLTRDKYTPGRRILQGGWLGRPPGHLVPQASAPAGGPASIMRQER